MRTFPDSSERNEFDAVVVRTDYHDDQAWQAVQAALAEPGENDDDPYTPWYVDDPTWADATVDDVLAAVAADENMKDMLSVVFVADKVTMQADHKGLLAVTTFTRDEMEDDEEWAYHTEFGTQFRTVPLGVNEVHANLELANMDFQEFSGAAHGDPEGVFRSWW